ncbi:MAG: methylated-DNA--[protein]-cysteine S-methyltransferase [Burkholderiaceae bacterium]
MVDDPSHPGDDAPGFACFDTPVGPCAIVWGLRGVLAVLLPEAGPAALRARARREFPRAHEAAPPADVQRAITGILALLHGARLDLQDVALDMARVPEFERRVYAIARTIPPGSTLTYGELAKRLGDPALARAVGRALGANPFSIVVPCHRVLAAGGKAGGFSAIGGVRTKLRLLQIEGAPLGGSPGLFDNLPP